MNQVPGDLWDNLTSFATLDAAWARVRSNGGCAGGDNVSIPQFQIGSSRKLMDLARALQAGSYIPSSYRHVDIPKSKGGFRTLRIPSLIDRVLHTALALVLTPILEPLFEDGSFAYRPGRSVKQAVHAIRQWRDEGYWHVIEADIVGFFDAVLHHQILEKLETAVKECTGANQVVDLVAYVLEHQAMECGSHNKGLAQGSPLSPLLANLYLDALDERIHGRGIRVVRFADDFVILCKKRKTAEKALQEVSGILEAHGLELHAGGTRILDFDRGFEFLGHLFVRSMIIQKISDPEDDVVGFMRGLANDDLSIAKKIHKETQAGYDRGARVLYIVDKDRRLTLRNLSFSVRSKSDQEIASIAHSRVDRIELGPGAQLDWAVLNHALASSTDLVLVNRHGVARGRLSRPDTGPAELQYAQSQSVADPDTRTALARSFVNARIRNQRTQLFRLNRRPMLSEVVSATADMGRTLRKLDGCEDVAGLRGLEGAAAAVYWPTIGLLCKGATKPFRRQRPAKDPLNAVINYLSAILARDVFGATVTVGLHPGFGVLHVPRDRADAAIYDLMEPFRAPLTEGLAVYLFNSNRLRPEMFTQFENQTIQISSEGRRAIITGYEQALAKRIKYPGKKSRLAWRPTMRRQSQLLARAYRAKDARLFSPYLMEA